MCAAVQVTIGSALAQVKSLIITEVQDSTSAQGWSFIAKLLIVVPDLAGCSNTTCLVPGVVSIPGRELQADGFDFTYISQPPPLIISFYPDRASDQGGQEVVFQVSNLEADPTTGTYNSSALTFKFGTDTAVATAVTAGSDGIVRVTVYAPACTAGAIRVVLTVSDHLFTQVEATSALEFLYYDSNPYVEYQFPQGAVLDDSTQFELHIGNQGFVPGSIFTVHLCGVSHAAVTQARDSTTTKLVFTTLGCLGEQPFHIQVDGTDLGSSASSNITFAIPQALVMPSVVSTAGYLIKVAVYGLRNQSSSTNDLQVILVQGLEVTSLVSSDANGWTIFTVNAPPVVIAGIQTGTVAHVSDTNTTQAFNILYTTPPTVVDLSPVGSFTTEAPLVTFNLKNLNITDDKSSLNCLMDDAELDVMSMSEMSSTEVRAVLKLPYHLDGIVLVKCSNSDRPEAGIASFEFTYILPAAVMTINQTQGSVNGGTALLVDLNHFAPVASVDELSVIFNDASGSQIPAEQLELIYSKAALQSSSSATQMKVTTPPAANGPGIVELRVVSSTQSASQAFLYIDTEIEVVSVHGMNASTSACTALENCYAASTGGSRLNVTISNFPLATKSDIIAQYSSKFASAESIEQYLDVSSAKVITHLVLDLQSPVESGTHRLTVSPSAGSQQSVFLDVDFEPAIQFKQTIFANAYFSELRFEFNTQIGKINGQEVVHNFACSDMLFSAETQLGTNECYLGQNRTVIIAKMQHTTDSITVSSALTIVPGRIESYHALSMVAETSTTVLKPTLTFTPLATVQGPSQISVCESAATFIGSGSVGAGVLSYSWSSTAGSTLHSFLGSLSPLAGQVTLPANLLPDPDKSVQICLQVSDFFNTVSAVECVTLFKSRLAIPTVMFTYVPSQLHIDQSNFIEAAGFFSSCGERQEVAYNWTLPVGVNTSAANILTNEPNLFLPRNVLAANTEYTFMLQVWPKLEPGNVGQTQVLIKTGYPDLRCKITGSGGLFSSNDVFVLDASHSSDPAGQDGNPKHNYLEYHSQLVSRSHC